jgi:hypothetical protein
MHCSLKAKKRKSADDPECWWGLDRVHLSCGKNAWRREWKDQAPPAEAPAAN